MIIGKYIPDNAIQVRYVHPRYDQDDDGNEYIWNEDEMTDVLDLINEVNRTRVPMYYRRRLSEYARDDARQWNRYINNNNRHYKDDRPLYVRMKKVGRRVLIEYDKAYWDKIFSSGKKITRDMSIVGQIRTPRATNIPREIENLISDHISDLAWEDERDAHEER
tara:strand:+ start:73 stop:564 length:492 start_codon:yes stop_codon:yes gene_type:complete